MSQGKRQRSMKNWVYYVFSTLILSFSIKSYAIDASMRMSKLQQKTENKRKEIIKQRKSILPIVKNEPPIEKKIDISTLTPRGRWRYKRKLVRQRRQKKFMSTMTYDELVETKNNYRKNNYLDYALKYVERLQILCDAHESADLLLEAADILYQKKELIKAAGKYAEFTLLYPGNKKIEYGLYKAIECTYNTTPTFDRDQSRTWDALNLIKMYLAHKTFTHYVTEVKKFEHSCYEKLAKAEFYICDFYLFREQYNAIIQRTKYLRETFIEHIPEIETNIVELEQKVPNAYWIVHQPKPSMVMQVI